MWLRQELPVQRISTFGLLMLSLFWLQSLEAFPDSPVRGIFLLKIRRLQLPEQPNLFNEDADKKTEPITRTADHGRFRIPCCRPWPARPHVILQIEKPVPFGTGPSND